MFAFLIILNICLLSFWFRGSQLFFGSEMIWCQGAFPSLLCNFLVSHDPHQGCLPSLLQEVAPSRLETIWGTPSLEGPGSSPAGTERGAAGFRGFEAMGQPWNPPPPGCMQEKLVLTKQQVGEQEGARDVGGERELQALGRDGKWQAYTGEKMEGSSRGGRVRVGVSGLRATGLGEGSVSFSALGPRGETEASGPLACSLLTQRASREHGCPVPITCDTRIVHQDVQLALFLQELPGKVTDRGHGADVQQTKVHLGVPRGSTDLLHCSLAFVPAAAGQDCPCVSACQVKSNGLANSCKGQASRAAALGPQGSTCPPTPCRPDHPRWPERPLDSCSMRRAELRLVNVGNCNFNCAVCLCQGLCTLSWSKADGTMGWAPSNSGAPLPVPRSQMEAILQMPAAAGPFLTTVERGQDSWRAQSCKGKGLSWWWWGSERGLQVPGA